MSDATSAQPAHTRYNPGGPVSSPSAIPPTAIWLGQGDVGYIVDALMGAAESRRAKGGRLQESIADHLDDLAIRLHEAKPDAIEVRR